MTKNGSTSKPTRSEKTVLRRKPLQASIEAMRAAGPRTLSEDELRIEFGPAFRPLWEDGYTAEEAADHYIAQIGSTSVRLRKQIAAAFRRLFAEFENGTWRPAITDGEARGDQTSQANGENASPVQPDEEQPEDNEQSGLGAGDQTMPDGYGNEDHQARGENDGQNAGDEQDTRGDEADEEAGQNDGQDENELPEPASTVPADEEAPEGTEHEQDADAYTRRRESGHAAAASRRGSDYGFER